VTDSFDKASQYAAELDEVIAPGALDKIDAIVPLTVYSGGVRTVIGSAAVHGNEIRMLLDDGTEFAQAFRDKQYIAASFSAVNVNPEIVMIKGN
jgi:hypothetical protein